MITPPHTFVLAVLMFTPLLAAAGAAGSCVKASNPLISVADFDANGVVNSKDIATLSQHIGGASKSIKPYYALYDRNADGKLDNTDVYLATREMGETSEPFDQELATIYNRFKGLQTVRGYEALTNMGYSAIPVPLKGHGVHWFSPEGMASLMGQKQPSVYSAEGLNVSTDEKRIHALFWASPADPVFANGATDYPNDDPNDPNDAKWKDSRVISFSNMPTMLTTSTNESWHKHGGLCMPLKELKNDAGDVIGITGEAHQHTTYNECQEYKSDVSMMADGSNLWANFYMVHMWLYDINPNGFFAGQHPCVEKDAPGDDTINGGRDVPDFFADHDKMDM